ncbi:unnamed protein product [Paramecium sonneborni]|uniref:Uncharacterized protein n=1 Tax=Paramecium sonneborni TaxID=65129 RepID=A0A8S1R9X7_9CILI|nr:unnamed protein product [Paramecium sonneborni]
MLQKVDLINDGPNLRFKFQQFNQTYGTIFQYENFYLEQTLHLRIEKQNYYRNYYLKNSFLEHLPNNKFIENGFDLKKKINILFKVVYFYQIKKKFIECYQVKAKDFIIFQLILNEKLLQSLLRKYKYIEIRKQNKNCNKKVYYQTNINELNFNLSVNLKRIKQKIIRIKQQFTKVKFQSKNQIYKFRLQIYSTNI